MQIQVISIEDYTAIYNELTNTHQQHPTTALTTISGTHHRLGQIVITSDPIRCMLIREKAA